MNEAEVSRVRSYLHRYIWLTAPAEGVVVDFIRQARLGEGPRLLAFGRAGTGKTRLVRVLSALLPDVVVIDGLVPNGVGAIMLRGSWTTMPMLATSDSRGMAAMVDREVCPVIRLPLVDRQGLVQAEVRLAVDERELLEAVRGVWA